VPGQGVDRGRLYKGCCWRRSISPGCRAVDAEALDPTGHYLPALYLAFNANNDTVSTDLRAARQIATLLPCPRSPVGRGSNRKRAMRR
jgi:hypothetical protein